MWEEYEFIRRQSFREVKEEFIDWLVSFKEWKIRLDLTFEGMAGPDKAMQSIEEFIKIFLPGAWVLVGYEKQARGAYHLHVLADVEADFFRARKFWNTRNGFSWICRLGGSGKRRMIIYAIKHAIKSGEVDLYGPDGGIYSSGPVKNIFGVKQNDKVA